MSGASGQPSYEKINYSVRSGKNIERKMIAEALLRLDRIRPLSDYSYVGFGGIFFTDFLLMHRILGVSDMTSIEEEVGRIDRIHFNKPLGSIRIAPGRSGQVFDSISWEGPTILWLDYDEPISSDVIADVETICTQLVADSVLLITVNVHPPALGGTKSRLDWLEGRIGKSRMPLHVRSEADLSHKRLPTVCRELLTDAIQVSLADKNGPLAEEQRLRFEQLFHFAYADGASMLTVGGILCNESSTEDVDQVFSLLPQIRRGAEPMSLRVPVLTPREVLHLSSQLPNSAERTESPGVPEEDLSQFAALFRHYPNYFDVEI